MFPYVHIWMATTDALLIGSRQELNIIDYGELQRWIAVRKMRERFTPLESPSIYAGNGIKRKH
jgi:hypothetical protein